ncbi:MAG: HEAT repeat domain-containing protein [Vicinamibacteria bacterium]|nr:HEAT repeat domain-containing protein [Vicinamibacteria bacterium]
MAIRALARLKTDETIDPLVGALKDSDLTVVTDASTALVRLGRASIDPLKALLDDSRKRVRQAALETLARIDPSLRKPRAAVIDAPVREEAVVLADAEARAAVAPLPGTTTEPVAKVKDGGVPLVPHEENTGPTAVRPVEEASAVSTAAASPEETSVAMAFDGPPRELILALKDEDSAIRNAALIILSKLYPTWQASRAAKAAIPDFVAGLHDPRHLVRASSARALGKIGEPLTIAVLKLTLNDRRSLVRQAAEEALEEIDDAQGELHSRV